MTTPTWGSSRATSNAFAISTTVSWRVEIVRTARRGNDVDQLRPSLQHLPRAGVSFQGEEVAPELARKDDRGRPPVGARSRDRGSRALAPPGPQQGRDGA